MATSDVASAAACDGDSGSPRSWAAAVCAYADERGELERGARSRLRARRITAR